MAGLKKLSFIVFVLLLTFSFCACGTAVSQEDSTKTTEENLDMSFDEMYGIIRSAHDNSFERTDTQFTATTLVHDDRGEVYVDVTYHQCGQGEDRVVYMGSISDNMNVSIYVGRIEDSYYSFYNTNVDGENRKYSLKTSWDSMDVEHGMVLPSLSSPSNAFLYVANVAGMYLWLELFDNDTPREQLVLSGKKSTKGRDVFYQFTVSDEEQSTGVMTILIKNNLLQSVEFLTEDLADGQRYDSRATFTYEQKELTLPSFEEYPLR